MLNKNSFFWIFICVFFALIVSGTIILNHDWIQNIHVDGRSYWFSSDGGQYLKLYEQYNKLGGAEDNFFTLAFIGVPVLMLLIANGSIASVLVFACLTYFFSMYTCLKYMPRKRGLFIFLVTLNPFIFLGFFSINKEIFLISSALLFLAYYNSLNVKYLFLCFVVMMFARSYMFVVYLFVVFVFPPKSTVNWKLLFFGVLIMNFAAPLFLNASLIGGTSGDLLNEAGSVAVIMSELIRKYLYFLVYFPKYLLLILIRIWSAYLQGIEGDYKSNFRDLLVSLYSIVVVFYSVFSIHRYKSRNFKFLLIAILSPLPLMFSDIFHWRYYIYVLPFFIYYSLVKDVGKPVSDRKY